MSKAVTKYRLMWPMFFRPPYDEEVTGVDLVDLNGKPLPTDHFDSNYYAVPPSDLMSSAGYGCRDITLLKPVELLSVTPRIALQTADELKRLNQPTRFFLYYWDANLMIWKNVMDNSAFSTAYDFASEASNLIQMPIGDQISQYAKNESGTWKLRAPQYFEPTIKKRTKDPLTGQRLFGNDYLFKWYGPNPEKAQIECDIDDLVDPTGWKRVHFENITSYSESSVGISFVRCTSNLIPQDGLTHAIRFRIRYFYSDSQYSDWVESEMLVAQHELEPPNPPKMIRATLVRDRTDVVPDRVRLEWEWADSNPGDAVELYCIDYLGKKHLLMEEGENTIKSALVEDVSRWVVKDTPPAEKTAYKFGIVSKNRTTSSDMLIGPEILYITCRLKEFKPPTPDEEAGTAEVVSEGSLLAKINQEVQLSINMTTEQKAQYASMGFGPMEAFLLAIKKVIMKGGTVHLANFGDFEASWSSERIGRNPATGEPVPIPASRGLRFSPSIGFKEGTKRGEVLTDAAAKALLKP